MARPAHAATADFIHAEGTRLVDGSGGNFAIKGINLGNWLVPEGYMFKFKHALSPSEIAGLVETLVGPEQANRFWSEFRDVYIAKDDIDFIKAAGFNTVRVPLNWRLFVELGETRKGRQVRWTGLGAAGPAGAMVRGRRPARHHRSACRARRTDRRQSR